MLDNVLLLVCGKEEAAMCDVRCAHVSRVEGDRKTVQKKRMIDGCSSPLLKPIHHQPSPAPTSPIPDKTFRPPESQLRGQAWAWRARFGCSLALGAAREEEIGHHLAPSTFIPGPIAACRASYLSPSKYFSRALNASRSNHMEARQCPARTSFQSFFFLHINAAM